VSAVSHRFRRGWFSDPEDWHGTYRMEIALRLLRFVGIEPEWHHSDRTGTIGTGLLQREGHVCDDRCRPIWPEWVTDDIFDAAYRLADLIQTGRGAWHQTRAYEAKHA